MCDTFGSWSKWSSHSHGQLLKILFFLIELSFPSAQPHHWTSGMSSSCPAQQGGSSSGIEDPLVSDSFALSGWAMLARDV